MAKRKAKAKPEETESTAAAQIAAEDPSLDLPPEEYLEKVDNGEKFLSLEEAIYAAQKAIVGIFKKAKHPQFKYTRGEAMIKFCREVAHKFGISIRGTGKMVVELPSGSKVLRSTFVVSHPASGQHYAADFDMPIDVHIVTKDGLKVVKTEDKAMLGTATESLAYFMRDLFAIPRFESDEDVNREEGVVEENFKTPQPTTGAVGGAGTGAPAAPGVTGTEFEALRKKITMTKASEKWILDNYKVDQLEKLDRAQFNHLNELLNQKLAADKVAAKTGGVVTKFEPKNTPTETPAASATTDTIEVQVINAAQANLVKQSLVARKRNEADLLVKFQVPTIEALPAAKLNEVMAWMING